MSSNWPSVWQFHLTNLLFSWTSYHSVVYFLFLLIWAFLCPSTTVHFQLHSIDSPCSTWTSEQALTCHQIFLLGFVQTLFPVSSFLPASSLLLSPLSPLLPAFPLVLSWITENNRDLLLTSLLSRTICCRLSNNDSSITTEQCPRTQHTWEALKHVL